MTSHRFPKMATATSQSLYFRFCFDHFAQLGRSKSICIPNFADHSLSTAEILLLPILGNKRPPCWNSIFGFDFHVCVIIGMSFCIFIQIEPSATELWRHIHFSRRQPRHRNSTSGFVLWLRSFRKVIIYLPTKFRREISIHGWDITISVLWKTNVRHVGILLPVLILTFASSSARHSASVCQISSISDHLRQSYDVISIFKMAATISKFYFRSVRGGVMT